MLLSIIIPHYNLPGELLERCIASIARLGMATDDYEIIIVDDASQTPPMGIEETFPDIDIRLIIAPHGGPGAARNRGIDEARGTYIEFVDADDMLVTGNDYMQCLDKLRNEKPQILRFNYSVITPNDRSKKEKTAGLTFSDTISGAEYMLRFNLSGSPCNYFFRRSLAMEKGVRFPENTYHEDEEFNTILHYHADTLIYSNAVLYRYCIREGSITANNSPEFETKRIDDMLHIIERLGHFHNTYSRESSTMQAMGFEHKHTMLAVDAILNMLYNGMDAKSILEKCHGRLAPAGLYPLPKRSYSMKYSLFRIMANSKIGMKTLRAVISSKKPVKQ